MWEMMIHPVSGYPCLGQSVLQFCRIWVLTSRCDISSDKGLLVNSSLTVEMGSTCFTKFHEKSRQFWLMINNNMESHWVLTTGSACTLETTPTLENPLKPWIIRNKTHGFAKMTVVSTWRWVDHVATKHGWWRTMKDQCLVPLFGPPFDPRNQNRNPMKKSTLPLFLKQ